VSRFIVDSASLDRIRERLAVLHGQLLSVPVIVGSYSGTMLGGRELEAELDGFSREWHHQVTGVAGDIDMMQLRLAAAALAYRQIEERQRERAREERQRERAREERQRERARHAKHLAPPPSGGAGIGSGTTMSDPGRGGHHHSGGSGHHHSGTGSGTTVVDDA